MAFTPACLVVGARTARHYPCRRPERPYVGKYAVPLYKLFVNLSMQAWSFFPEEGAEFSLGQFHNIREIDP